MRDKGIALLVLVILLSGCGGKSGTTTSEATSSSSMTETVPTTATSSTTTTNTTAPPPPVPATAFNLTATGCRELVALFNIPAQQARRFVPTGYAPIGEETGNAVAFGGLKVCSDVKVDGVSIGPASTSDVGVLVSSPDGSGDNHYYQTWWLTDNPRLAERLVAQGWRGGLVPNTTLASSLLYGEGTVTVNVPWANGTYTLSATIVAASAPPANTFTGWHEVANGTLAVHKTLTSTALGSGPATLTASGPMADLVGASATGSGVYNEYSMEGTVGKR
jgi:hypothetical protein